MKKAGPILLVLVLAGFGYGLTVLFKLRFESGDVYPPYSSLRSDPLGTKALYESLGNLVSVERNFRQFLGIDSGRGSTLFVVGVAPGQLRVGEADFKDLQQYVVSGGRLLISFNPIYSARELSTRPWSQTNSIPGFKSPKKQRRGKKSEDEEIREQDGISLGESWKFGLEFAALDRNAKQTYTPAKAEKIIEEDLPDSVLCHTALYFDKLDPAWDVVYARTNDRAVVVSRKLGSGSIVLAADSFWFSNEALLNDRQSRLLTWFTGPSHSAIFDETHLGVQENRGVATLARKYRLHGFVAGLLLFAGLFAWRYASTLLPFQDREINGEQNEFVAGKDSAAGFTNLLRRNIRPRELLKVCLEEWNKSCRNQVTLSRLEKIQRIIDAQNNLPERQRNPLAAYHEITQALARTAQQPAVPAPPPRPV